MPPRPGARSVYVTRSEAEVLDLLVKGFGDAEIAVTMGTATRTVNGSLARTASMIVTSMPWVAGTLPIGLLTGSPKRVRTLM